MEGSRFSASNPLLADLRSASTEPVQPARIVHRDDVGQQPVLGEAPHLHIDLVEGDTDPQSCPRRGAPHRPRSAIRMMGRRTRSSAGCSPPRPAPLPTGRARRGARRRGQDAPHGLLAVPVHSGLLPRPPCELDRAPDRLVCRARAARSDAARVERGSTGAGRASQEARNSHDARDEGYGLNIVFSQPIGPSLRPGMRSPSA